MNFKPIQNFLYGIVINHNSSYNQIEISSQLLPKRTS